MTELSVGAVLNRSVSDRGSLNSESFVEDGSVKRIASSADGPVVGYWYWVKNVDRDGEESEWLGCAMKVGSNFVEVCSPYSRELGNHRSRVHLKDFWTDLRHEPDADTVIKNNIVESQQDCLQLMEQVQALTAQLGMRQHDQPVHASADSGNALMVLSGARDVKAYGKELELAKTDTLPTLFKSIEKSNEVLAKWMKAPTMPMLAAVSQMKEGISDIDDRIFSIKLYAGLTEEVVQCCTGTPAGADERLHVMQRMTYMDEECLANYKHGGMEYNDIGEFDRFMSEPENRDRILPFPRTLVAMRVRRNAKDRESHGNLSTALINLRLEQADKLTFLYIRNGDQVWRLSCDLDFGSLIFPERAIYDPLEPKMALLVGNRIEKFMLVSEWEERRTKYEVGVAAYNLWQKANPGNTWINNPHRDFGWSADFYPDHWSPVDHTNVYFDECMEKIGTKMKEYNRVALIIQGLFDRSAVLHPHPPVQTWSADGFDKAVKLVYDGSDVITHGEPPDFEVYRSRCNASLQVGSTTVGQDQFWETKEAQKESKRRDNDWRDKSSYRPDTFRPYGDPGPGYVAIVQRKTKSAASFTWSRTKRSGEAYWNKKVDCVVTVPIVQLFNVDAYKPGDFKQFFADSRTRSQYLKWAPLLLAAEEHHAKLIQERNSQ